MTATSRRKFIICLDTTLLIIFLLLLSPRMTGLALHEVLGFIFFILLIIHLLIAWRWIQSTTSKFLRNATKRTRFNFFLNIIIFILAIIEVVSGVFISEVVFPAFGIKTINDSAWRSVHNQTLNFTVLFVALHIAVNWSWIASVFKKRLSVPKQGTTAPSFNMMTIHLRISMLICATGIIILVLYSIIGSPSLERLYNQNEIARFTPTFGHGIGQFLGETFLIALYVFVARKWLRVKL